MNSQLKNKAQAPTNRITALFMAVILITCIFAIVAVAALLLVPRFAQNEFGDPVQMNNYDKIRLSYRLLRDHSSLNQSTSNNYSNITVYIEQGETVEEIARHLEREQLIPDTQSFINYLQYKGLDVSLQAGKHKLNSSMTPIEIAHALQDPEPGSIIIGILPGWRVEEIARSIESYGIGLESEKFIQLAQNPAAYSINSALPISSGAEGFLAPGNYEFDRDAIDEQTILYALLYNFEFSLGTDWLKAFETNGLTLYQAVIMASIIEKETILVEEMPIIASVFYNRLENNMRLEMDSTTQYALGFDKGSNSWWKNPLTFEDLQVDSPYNTYQVEGFPPGPISNPSLAALEAVAFPKTTPYLYFRASCDDSGRHNFAETFSDHLNNQCP
ncbi:MAG: endolytic transglycosylase MltG [Anaerolineaceae bacterium]|nr:endolytic transglycosylase MltG [Anaerolineaceae bacterium]